MVNHTAIHTDAEIFDDECPNTDYGNHTDDQQDGEFEWSTSKQGWILSSFFYGYVLTQVMPRPMSWRSIVTLFAARYTRQAHLFISLSMMCF